MSWKGFTKAVARLPHIVAAKAGYAEETIDEDFQKVELTFKDLEQSTKDMENDVKKYKAAVSDILKHQKLFGTTLQNLIEFDPQSEPSVMQACLNDYVQSTNEWNDKVGPLVDEQVQKIVVSYTDNFVGIVKAVRMAIDKRNRKQIDHDRRLTAMKKAQEANDKSNGAKISELSKAEVAYDEARRDYETLNNKIKEEMPVLFQLRISFMDPFLQTLIFFQISYFHYGVSGVQIAANHLDLSNTDIEAVFKSKIEAPIEGLKALTLVNPKLIDSSAESRDPMTALMQIASEKRGGASMDLGESSPPSYDVGSPSAGSSAAGAAAGATASPKLDKKVPVASGGPKKAIAVFAYASDTPGDLSFNKDDVIEIVQMTGSADDWWTGRVDGREGYFPANYVQLM